MQRTAEISISSGLIVGCQYLIKDNDGTDYKGYFARTGDWFGRPVLTFIDTDTNLEMQLNPSYIASISQQIEEDKILNSDRAEITIDNF